MTSETTSSALSAVAREARLTPADAEAIYLLLEERIRRYTMGDSTSVPVDTARRLLEGVLYCLDLNRRFLSPEHAASTPLKTRWQAGVHTAKRMAQRAKLLLLQVQRNPPPLVNTAYRDTLDALPSFFAGYDADFFPQEIPCSFDYPLCQPVSESLLGAEYMQDYLRRLLAENALLRALPREALLSLYQRYYVDYADLLVNLYLPAAEMAPLCVLAGESVLTLSLPQEKLGEVNRLLTESSQAEAEMALSNAVERASTGLGLQGDLFLQIAQQTAADLLVRLRAARDARGVIEPQDGCV